MPSKPGQAGGRSISAPGMSMIVAWEPGAPRAADFDDPSAVGR